MTTPDRDRELQCPACGDAVLRKLVVGRLVCDRCHGLFTTREDFVKAIEELGGLEVELQFYKEAPGKRACPHCRQPMTACRLRLKFAVIDKEPKTHPVLDRCDTDGVWFDNNELAEVFEVVVHTTGGRGGGRSVGPMQVGNGFGWGFGS